MVVMVVVVVLDDSLSTTFDPMPLSLKSFSIATYTFICMSAHHTTKSNKQWHTGKDRC